MKYKDWLKFIHKNPRQDLDGRFVAYDIDSRPIGEITYKRGVVVSKKIKERKP
jgi:hypothetical protein